MNYSESEADWSCLHLGNKVQVKNGHFYVGKGNFGTFSRFCPGWAGRVEGHREIARAGF